ISEQRPECTVSRWGGEEFLILSDKSLEEEAEAFEKLRKLVESTPFEFEGNTLHITVTVGLASKRENEPIDQWVDHADDLLYYGKNNGRNQVISREPDLS
ncbi:MAG: GGDEF domain-containing protein, partial [Lachnospiraceae bacterium]|nr:GGDEF domain-containing protein [Lachnospiraceae bacterium]